jgi:TetR/AcrR family transcriptional regulator, regulator of cefoperazone and chloramphenicol sensitivity
MAEESTRARLLETAGEVFAEKGYEAATVREICDQAGVNLAAINYYFGGKESLYVQTLECVHAGHPSPDELPDWPSGTPPAKKLRHFIEQVLGHMLSLKDEPWQSRLMIREIMNPTPAGRQVLRDHFRHAFRQLQDILEEILPPEMPRHKRHQVNFSIIGQCVLYRGMAKIVPLLIDEDELRLHYGIGELAEHITQASLAMLGLSPPSASTMRGKRGRKRNLSVAGTVAKTG